jgi:hypothetical protein
MNVGVCSFENWYQIMINLNDNIIEKAIVNRGNQERVKQVMRSLSMVET